MFFSKFAKRKKMENFAHAFHRLSTLIDQSVFLIKDETGFLRRLLTIPALVFSLTARCQSNSGHLLGLISVESIDAPPPAGSKSQFAYFYYACWVMYSHRFHLGYGHITVG